MKQVLELLGFIALVQGVLGLLHEWVHWDVGFVRRAAFLDGYEIYASVALVVLAIALFAFAETRSERS
ncbi:hypothetical protein [Streptomyces sp. enrichment culture]|uniref:hypothetical protein n=1 Tax=Streptomyces sp. enrichment culture TaxID=1795815 RepID=UPI003F55437B